MKETIKAYMKNILAENLLRFGAKNLTETDRSKLAEQATEPNNPTPNPDTEEQAAPNRQTAPIDPRVAIIQQWGDKKIIGDGRFQASPLTAADKNEYETSLKLDGRGFVEFQLMFNPPLVSVSNENISFVAYKYNFKNDTWLSSSGDIKSGNIQPYKWISRHPGDLDRSWDDYDYDVRNIMKNMEISVKNPFIKTLKSQLGQPTLTIPK